MRRFLVLASLATLACLAFVSPVAAAKPDTERVELADDFIDPDLSAACGFDVRFQATGHITFRLFNDSDGNPVRELNNYAIQIFLSSESGALRLHDVGADRVEYLADGSLVLTVIGDVQSVNIPGQGRVFFEVGRVMTHITFDASGEPTFTLVSQSGQHEGDQAAAICEALGD